MARQIGGQRRTEFEKVVVDEWVPGKIEAVQFDANKTYKAKNKETGEWETKTAAHVRFKFALEGCRYPHYSRWMKASTNEKSNLYSKFLKYLCPQYDCQDKVIDIDLLTGAAVKTMWENSGEYQNLAQIRGQDPTLNIIASGTGVAPGLEDPPEGHQDAPDDGDVPF